MRRAIVDPSKSDERWARFWHTPVRELLPLMPPHRVEAFWALAERKGPEECWPWIGMKDSHGYGVFKLRSETRATASRVAYAITFGEPGKGHVCHACDNPSCVNPAHLWLGNAKANSDDKRAKGRARGRFSPRYPQAKGSNEPNAPAAAVK